MPTPLTYVQFHALYVLPPVAALTATATRRRSDFGWRVDAVGYLLVAALAVAYTLPWDGYLIQRGVWYYGDGRVFARLWTVPIEEILFFVLQPALTALWTYTVTGPVVRGVRHSWRDRGVGALGGLGVGLVGVVLLTSQSTFYLGAILAWAGPVLALQWAVGWRYLWRVRREAAIAVAVPSAYLWLVDALALRAGVWTIADEFTTGIAVAGLPIEEMAFFAVTNLFVVQGLVLFRWVLVWWREPAASEKN